MGHRDGNVRFKIDPISRAEQLHRKGNFEDGGQLYLVRCYGCDHVNGRENHITFVARGICAWCGWNDDRVR